MPDTKQGVVLCLLALAALTCRPTAPPTEQLYAEILRSPESPTHRIATPALALQPVELREDGRLVDDAGHLLPNDSLPGHVVTALLAGHLVSEVCRSQRRIPAEFAWCWVDSAQSGVRFSRPIAGDSGSWRVLVEVEVAHLLRDSSQAELRSAAMRYACRLVPVADGWRVVGCPHDRRMVPQGSV